ncbi:MULTISPECIES: endonuclease dU [Calothrix]|uniref:DUF99 family protein n=2 Tax=Calothrix TaxID=1186 RepID=A0ABR8AJU9_9CYAN|nr:MULTISPECIES: DUF99 family protein [Calothrix]MBD2200253.1 DUF99 family protein [Calothrix parietina FACHB-288]MBD2229226.1 DUF99 family protein [Calothrix anomala FACHB-343]
MKLESLVKLNRTIRVIGFDDAPFVKGVDEYVSLAGVVCAGTRFEGMVWGKIHQDGFDATDVICNLLIGKKFLPQLHLVLLDGIAFGGFNVVNLPELSLRLQLPCVTVMRRQPDLAAVEAAMKNLPEFQKRYQILQQAGTIYDYAPFFFQVSGEEPAVIAQVLERLTDCGKVPEALRLAHLITAAVMTGESGSSA